MEKLQTLNSRSTEPIANDFFHFFIFTSYSVKPCLNCFSRTVNPGLNMYTNEKRLGLNKTPCLSQHVIPQQVHQHFAYRIVPRQLCHGFNQQSCAMWHSRLVNGVGSCHSTMAAQSSKPVTRIKCNIRHGRAVQFRIRYSVEALGYCKAFGMVTGSLSAWLQYLGYQVAVWLSHSLPNRVFHGTHPLPTLSVLPWQMRRTQHGTGRTSQCFGRCGYIYIPLLILAFQITLRLYQNRRFSVTRNNSCSTTLQLHRSLH